MNLHGERGTCIEELQQEREPLEPPSQFPQQGFRPLLHQLPEGLSLERAIGDEAGIVLAVTQEPGFADGVITGQRSG